MLPCYHAVHATMRLKGLTMVAGGCRCRVHKTRQVAAQARVAVQQRRYTRPR